VYVPSKGRNSVTTKKLEILVFGADGELWKGTGARLRIVDTNRQGGPVELRNKPIRQPIIRVELEAPFDAGQAYIVSLSAPGHRPAWQVIWRPTFLQQELGQEVEKQEVTLRLMLVPKKPTSADLVHGFDKLTQSGSFLARVWGGHLPSYGKLTPQQQMALLNVEAKLRETGVGTHRLASFVTGIRQIEPDRLYILVKAELKQLIERSRDFAAAPGHAHPPGNGIPGHPDSWKRVLHASGELQLSFSAMTELWPEAVPNEPCFSVDADIDLGRGMAHVCEWLDNNVLKPGQKTDQTAVYALLFSQNIRPYYTLSQIT
jgi:hypothetical protein